MSTTILKTFLELLGLRKEHSHMSNTIRLIITLLTTLLFLTACSQSEQTGESNVETKQDVKELSLEEKINNKQQYIVIRKDVDYDLNGNKSQKHIEDASNYMTSKNYELKHQNITFRDSGIPKHIILTFEYKGD